MNIINAGDYQDFKTIVGSLPFKPDVIFITVPPLDFRVMALFHEWNIAVIGGGDTNPTPPPGVIKPATFDTDFPGAVALAGLLPAISETFSP